MGNQILRTVGTQICFANHSGDFAPSGVLNLQQGVPGEAQINLDAVADTEARASDKIDLGEQRAPAYRVDAVLHWIVAPTLGDNVEFYWGATPDPTSSNGNPGNLTGSDADYAGYVTLADGVSQLDYIGNFTVAPYTAWPQSAPIGTFSPTHRYGILVVKNESAQNLSAYTSQMHITFTPIIDEVE